MVACIVRLQNHSRPSQIHEAIQILLIHRSLKYIHRLIEDTFRRDNNDTVFRGKQPCLVTDSCTRNQDLSGATAYMYTKKNSRQISAFDPKITTQLAKQVPCVLSVVSTLDDTFNFSIIRSYRCSKRSQFYRHQHALRSVRSNNEYYLFRECF